jgi:hypothetical protein
MFLFYGKRIEISLRTLRGESIKAGFAKNIPVFAGISKI